MYLRALEDSGEQKNVMLNLFNNNNNNKMPKHYTSVRVFETHLSPSIWYL